jgi:hypothetical protein
LSRKKGDPNPPPKKYENIQKAVLIHGGAVKAENAPGGGLVVEIRMPCSVPIRTHRIEGRLISV